MTHLYRNPRKTSPGVRGGKVRKTDRVAETPSYWNTPQPVPIVDKEHPGKGFRHFLTKMDVYAFIGILPEWETLSKGLDAVLLACGEKGEDGWYTRSVVAVSAWEQDCWRVVPADYYHVHKNLFSRLGVVCEKLGGEYQCRFFPAAIKAFQLLHVLLHELGHHYDRMTTRRQHESSRGESFAESYAARYGESLWNRYMEQVRY